MKSPSTATAMQRESLIFPTIILFLAPVIIFVSLVLLNSVILTFLLFYIVVCFVLPIIDLRLFLKLRREKLNEYLGLFRIDVKIILLSILIGSLFGSGIYIGFSVLEKWILDLAVINQMLSSWNIDSNSTIFLFIVLVFINPVFEELIWRGYMTRRFSDRLGNAWGIIISSLGYASYHLITTGFLFSWSAGILLSLTVFGAGVFWSIWRNKTSSIIPAIISHALADLGILLVYINFIVPGLN